MGKFRVGVELYCVVLAEDRRTDKVTTKEVAQSHCGNSQGSIEQWLASWGLSVVSSSFFSTGPWGCSPALPGGWLLSPAFPETTQVSQRTEKIMLITLAVFLPSPPQDSMTTSVNIATGFLTGQYHDSFPDLTIFIGSCVPCADIEMVRGSLSVALKVPLILIKSLSPQCQAKCWHTHLGMDTQARTHVQPTSSGDSEEELAMWG